MLLLVVQIELKRILVFPFIDFLRKVQNLKSNKSELLEEETGLLCKHIVGVVNTLLSLALFRGKTNCRLHKDVVLFIFPQIPEHLQKLS